MMNTKRNITDITIVELIRWKEAKDALDRYKEEELRLRKEVLSHFKEQKAGTTTYYVSDGSRLKVTKGVNYTVDEDMFSLIEDDLQDDELDAVRVKHELRLREYNKLPEDSILRTAVTAKPALPSVEWRFNDGN